MEEKDKVEMENFSKNLRVNLFLSGMKRIVKMATELREFIKAVSMLTDCGRKRFSEILVDVLFNDKPLEGFSEELGIKIPKTKEEEKEERE